MKKMMTGALLGTAAGVIDLIPMVMQHLPWDANISALLFWIVNGMLMPYSFLPVKPVVKGVVHAFLTMRPVGVLIGTKEPFSLIPVGVMTLILGALLGWLTAKFAR